MVSLEGPVVGAWSLSVPAQLQGCIMACKHGSCDLASAWAPGQPLCCTLTAMSERRQGSSAALGF